MMMFGAHCNSYCDIYIYMIIKILFNSQHNCEHIIEVHRRIKSCMALNNG